MVSILDKEILKNMETAQVLLKEAEFKMIEDFVKKPVISVPYDVRIDKLSCNLFPYVYHRMKNFTKEDVIREKTHLCYVLLPYITDFMFDLYKDLTIEHNYCSHDYRICFNLLIEEKKLLFWEFNPFIAEWMMCEGQPDKLKEYLDLMNIPFDSLLEKKSEEIALAFANEINKVANMSLDGGIFKKYSYIKYARIIFIMERANLESLCMFMHSIYKGFTPVRFQ